MSVLDKVTLSLATATKPNLRYNRVFLSAVSCEFRSHRTQLAEVFRQSARDVKVQEDFVTGGETTLEKLDRYIRSCDTIVHLIGDAVGDIPPTSAIDSIVKKYPNLTIVLPPLADFLTADSPSISYTQWEAYLAIYHAIPVYIYRAAPKAPRDANWTKGKSEATLVDERQSQERHFAAICDLGRDRGEFSNVDELCTSAQKGLAELTNAGRRPLLNRLLTLRPNFAALAAMIAILTGIFFILNNRPPYNPRYFTPEAAFNSGLTYDSQGNHEKASEAYTAAVAMDGTYCEARINLGVVLAVLGRTEEAADQFEEVAELYPTESRCYSNLAILRLKSGNYPEAQELLETAIKLGGETTQNYHNLGIIRSRLGDIESAKDAYEAGLRIQPKHAPSLNNLGVMEFERGNYQSAFQLLTGAKAADAEFAEARYNLALTLRKLNDIAAAIAEVEEFMALNVDEREMSRANRLLQSLRIQERSARVAQ